MLNNKYVFYRKFGIIIFYRKFGTLNFEYIVDGFVDVLLTYFVDVLNIDYYVIIKNVNNDNIK